MKRKIALVCAAAMALSLAACGSTSSESAASSSEAASSESTAASSEAASSEAASSESTEAAAGDFDATQAINVVSREDGSGTRGAFIELTGVEDDNGDNTTQAAVIQELHQRRDDHRCQR